MNFLELTNATLLRLNEVQLTTANFASAVNIQAHAKNAVNNSMLDINNAELEWPFNFSTYQQLLTPGVGEYSLPTDFASVDWESFFLRPPELISNSNFTTDISGWTNLSTGTGSIAYTATGNGRMRLNAGASGVAKAEYPVNTIVNKQYTVKFRVFNGTINVNVGTTSGANDIASFTNFTYTESGTGQFFTFNFTATSTVTYLQFYHSVNANYDLDLGSVKQNLESIKMQYVTFDKYQEHFREFDEQQANITYGTPTYVYPTKNNGFGVTRLPASDWEVVYGYWKRPTLLDLYSDTPLIPVRYHHSVIVDGAVYYMYMFRDNIEAASLVFKIFGNGIMKMRTEMIERPVCLSGDPMFQKKSRGGIFLV